MDDLLDVLENEEALREQLEKRVSEKRYFGKFHHEVWECVLAKGVGKMPFDPSHDKPEHKHYAIRIEVTPLPSANVDFVPYRECLADSEEWLDIAMPSLKNLGGRNHVEGKWVEYVWEKYGTYPDKVTGEIKDKTMFKFLSLYNSEAEAQTAADELYGTGNNGGNAQTEQPKPTGMTRDGAYLFLKAFIHEVGGDLERLAAKLAANPSVGQFYTINDPEVAKLVAELEKPF